LTKKLTTARLDLIPATGALVRAEIEDLGALFRLLAVEPAPDWPPADTVDALPIFAEQLERNPTLAGWLSWYWVLRGERPALVGNGGFKGPPGPDGAVELGYFVRSRFRRQGYALGFRVSPGRAGRRRDDGRKRGLDPGAPAAGLLRGGCRVRTRVDPVRAGARGTLPRRRVSASIQAWSLALFS
jgi:hypothetical protein